MQVSRRIPISGSPDWQIKVSRCLRPAGEKAAGSTVAEFLAEPRHELSKRSVVASVASELSSVELRSVLSPKNTLPRVFQYSRRAVRGKKSERISGRFATSLRVASVAFVASKVKPLPSLFFVEGPATLQ